MPLLAKAPSGLSSVGRSGGWVATLATVPPPQSPTLVPLAFKCQSGRQLQPWPLALAPP